MGVGAAGLCVDDRGRALLVLQGKPAEGVGWAIPGGGTVPEESLEACCAREVWEETGYRVSARGRVHVKTRSPFMPESGIPVRPEWLEASA